MFSPTVCDILVEEYAGKVVFVTGAASGIGAAQVIAFLETVQIFLGLP